MDSKKLLNLIKKEEGIKLDFKLKLSLENESSKKELAKDVCAIANSRGGRGYIVIGIEDKSKRIVGLANNEVISEEQIQQIIEMAHEKSKVTYKQVKNIRYKNTSIYVFN